MNVSLVIPSRNNLKYVKFAYDSIREYMPEETEVILLDDASTDGTWEWMKSVQGLKTQISRNEGPDRIGHTVLYDQGAKMATNEVFGIFHADMVASISYIPNMVKHLKRGTVVSATRIEPPLHPPGPEKHTLDFGMEPENFKKTPYIQYTIAVADRDKDMTTQGIFAPWMMYKEDFFAIGGHDKRVFAPMELEDSDLFNRFLLKGYKFVQARDALVYHMTCRGSRFKDGIKITQEIPLGGGHVWKRAEDSDEYTKLRQIKFREWWRKWHMDVLHDENMKPIIWPRYDIGYDVENCSLELMPWIEPWCDTLYIDNPTHIQSYLETQQSQTKFNLIDRILYRNATYFNDILIKFDGRQITSQNFEMLKKLPLLIQDSGEVGELEYDIFKIVIKTMKTYEKNLINADDPWYISKLL
jgi:glycosyltransferase involved in cell wall biosynthesis